MVAGPLAESLLGKAQEKGLLRARVVDIRDFAQGKHRVTDDVPYGGGAGMVMKPEPLVSAIEAVARLVPGVLGNEESTRSESFAGEMLLEGPQYTRPPEFRGMAVPEPLLSGDHARIARWRRRQALLRTRERRPDLFDKLHLSAEDVRLLEREEA